MSFFMANVCACLATIMSFQFFGERVGFVVAASFAFIGFVTDRIVERVVEKLTPVLTPTPIDPSALAAGMMTSNDVKGISTVATFLGTGIQAYRKFVDKWDCYCVFVEPGRLTDPAPVSTASIISACHKSGAIDEDDRYCVQFSVDEGPVLLDAEDLEDRVTSIVGDVGRCPFELIDSPAHGCRAIVIPAEAMLSATPQVVMNACRACTAVRKTDDPAVPGGELFCIQLPNKPSPMLLTSYAVESVFAKASS